MLTNEGQPEYPQLQPQQYPQLQPQQYPQPLQPQPVQQPVMMRPVVIQQQQQAPEKYICDFCQKEFDNKRILEAHYKKFHNNLLNCCAAGAVNCLGAFLGYSICITAGARNNFDGSNFCFNCCCVSEPAIRNIIREGYGINGSCCEDILKSTICAPCNAIQLVAETRLRGEVKVGPVRQQMN
jgi:hypothetical protein